MEAADDEAKKSVSEELEKENTKAAAIGTAEKRKERCCRRVNMDVKEVWQTGLGS